MFAIFAILSNAQNFHFVKHFPLDGTRVIYTNSQIAKSSMDHLHMRPKKFHAHYITSGGACAAILRIEKIAKISIPFIWASRVLKPCGIPCVCMHCVKALTIHLAMAFEVRTSAEVRTNYRRFCASTCT